MKSMTRMMKWARSFASNWRRLKEQAEVPKSANREQCPRCGAPIIPLRLTIREIVIAGLCGALFLSVVVPACWATEQWVERQAQRMLDRTMWHEPLDDWNR